MCIVVRLARSLLVLCCCSFLSGHRLLILCAAVAGTSESVPSYQAGWQRCLALFSIHFCCHVVAGGTEAVGDCSLLRPPAVGEIRPSSARRSPARLESGLRSPDRLVSCGCLPFQQSPRTHLSASLGWRSMAKVRTSVGLALPNSPFAEAPKSESITVFGTVLFSKHRLGVIRVQTSSETYCLLQLGSSRSPF